MITHGAAAASRNPHRKLHPIPSHPSCPPSSCPPSHSEPIRSSGPLLPSVLPSFPSLWLMTGHFWPPSFCNLIPNIALEGEEAGEGGEETDSLRCRRPCASRRLRRRGGRLTRDATLMAAMLPRKPREGDERTRNVVPPPPRVPYNRAPL